MTSHLIMDCDYVFIKTAVHETDYHIYNGYMCVISWASDTSYILFIYHIIYQNILEEMALVKLFNFTF